jgi:glutamyl-tRNA(Gln) amidotransferase subunit E
MRPRPGAARMYPETDIPPMQITEDYIKKIDSGLPELPEQKLKRLMEEHRLNQKLAKQILDSEYSGVFEAIVREGSVSSTTVAAFLTETLKALKRDGVEVDRVSERQMREIFKSVSTGELMKEALQDVFVWLSRHEGESLQKAISSLGLRTVSADQLDALIDKVIEDNKGLIQERGEGCFGVLMGIVMKRLRGKVDAARVSKVLKEKLREVVK